MIDSDVSKFVENAENSWKEIYGGSSKAANTNIRVMDKIVARKVADGTVLDFLVPLLSHNLAAVRYAAAAYLMNHEAKDQAILVLRELVKNEAGLISSGASAVLRVHKVPSAS